MSNSTRRRRGAGTPSATPGNPAAELEALVAGKAPDATSEAEPVTAEEPTTEVEVTSEDAGPRVVDPTGAQTTKPKSNAPVAPAKAAEKKTAKQIVQDEMDAKEAADKKAAERSAALVMHNQEIDDPSEAAHEMGLKPGQTLTLAQANTLRAVGNRNKELEMRKLGSMAGKIVTDTLLAKEGLRIPSKQRKNKRGEAMKAAAEASAKTG